MSSHTRITGLFLGVLLSVSSVFAQEPLPSNSELAEQYFEILESFPSEKEALTLEEARDLFSAVRRNPVAGPHRIERYEVPYPDRLTKGAIGYCYGRAMAVVLEARKMGLESDSIKKLFIVGRMMEQGRLVWRFHVATLVRVEGVEGWVAVDTGVFQGLLSEVDWAGRIKTIWDQDNVAKFYRVDHDVVLPNITVVPPYTSDEDNEETGERLIEVGFAPEDQPNLFEAIDYPAIRIGGRRADAPFYIPTSEAQDIHFIRLADGALNDFDFYAIEVKRSEDAVESIEFHYRGEQPETAGGYFYDLIEFYRGGDR